MRKPSRQPSEIANLAWAFAKTGLASEQVMKRLAKQAVPQIGGFKAMEITMRHVGNGSNSLCFGPFALVLSGFWACFEGF